MTSEAPDRRGGYTFRGRPGSALSGSPRLLLGAIAVVGMTTLASCSTDAPAPPPTASPTPTPDSPYSIVFSMDFDGDDLLASEPQGAARVSEETFFGGELTVVKSHTDNGLAIRFPEFVDVEDEPGVGLVALAVQDPLPSPGRSAFGFGADILFDEHAPPSDADNGDNVLQRGLASDPSQLKLQVDDGKPSCTVTGSAGRLLVKGDLLQEATWYRIACLLDDEGLQMIVTDLDDDQDAEFAEAGSVGDVTFADDIPIAIGRKAGPEGVGIKKQPDQFNGTMDSVWIGIDEER